MNGFPGPLVLGTGNADKAGEIAHIFTAAFDVMLLTWALEVGDDGGFLMTDVAEPFRRPQILMPLEVEETGSTLDENARIKARGWMRSTGLLAVADDTGLSVDALDGAPGVYSARYAGEDATYGDNVTKLLGALDGVPPGRRTARFETVALAVRPDGSELLARGSVEGTIAVEARGTSGFGYDPVFVPSEGDGRTFSQMDPAEKHALSHRGRAFRALATRFRQR
ncbi:MAG: non-canonical purine pyrophosphatase, RdgB/HAM1 family [Actinomycetia bacterium]|nr:non-canonical purine pyrophosphatase, RdgB/HAM1 family [Actinomycetes bacterium]